jgi:hypothetical protein
MTSFGYTKVGACKILKEDGARIQIQLATRKTPQWVSRTHLIAPPKSLRLAAKTAFDQKCGCNKVVDVNGTKVECYNVYGKLAKFCASKQQGVVELTPHLSRKFLKENGFVRATGQKPRTMRDVSAFLYEKVQDGYKAVDVPASRKTRKAKAVSAKAPAPVEAEVAAPVTQ